MVGDNIKSLRMKAGLTQKDLAEKLFVTSQAVSRWENGDVEPSISTLQSLSDIFNVSIDEIIGRELKEKKQPENKEDVEEKIEKELSNIKQELKEEIKRNTAPVQKPVLGVCSSCNEPIYNKEDIVRIKTHGDDKIVCKKCDNRMKDAENKRKIRNTIIGRKKGYIWGAIAAIAILALMIWFDKKGDERVTIPFIIFSMYGSFALVSCLFLPNNAIKDIIEEIIDWGFVRFPGLIFTLDIDGILWLISVKILFFFLGIILICGAFILSLMIGMVCAMFVYPFALVKSYRRPNYEHI